MKRKDYFISYNKADKSWARVIRDALEDTGKTTVMQEADFHAGSNFPLEMHKGLQEARRMIGVLSNDYLDSEFCQSEWAAKFREDPTGRQRLLIFAKVKECALDGLVASIVHVNLVGLDVDTASARLLEELEKITEGKDSRSVRTKRAAVKNDYTPPIPTSPSTGMGGMQIIQKSSGSHSQNIGVQNVGRQILTTKTSVKNVVVPGDAHITMAQRSELHALLQELGNREAAAAVSNKFPEGPQNPEEKKEAKELEGKIFGFLRSAFNKQVNEGQSYHLLPKEQYGAALKWIAQRRAMKRPSLRRTDNEVWRRDHEIIIWKAMRDRDWDKAKVYAFTVESGIRSQPITSLKELKERELEAFAKAMKSRKGRSSKK